MSPPGDLGPLVCTVPERGPETPGDAETIFTRGVAPCGVTFSWAGTREPWVMACDIRIRGVASPDVFCSWAGTREPSDGL